jgi:hypothetical protein
MKASELRLGNWVEQPNDGVTRVTAVLNDLQIKTETGYVDKYCRPIPLTEEWLLKFGFKDLPVNYMGFYEFKIGTFSIIREQDEYCFPYETYSGDNIDLEIKHVHQLQNLYFALTGEELELS